MCCIWDKFYVGVYKRSQLLAPFFCFTFFVKNGS